MRTNNKTGFKGVCIKKGYKKRPYVAQITVNKDVIHLGYFSNPFEAALEYNQAATKYFRKFANINQVGRY